jgi:uncharacterized membrane protein YqaE (UPF0057 family)
MTDQENDLDYYEPDYYVIKDGKLVDTQGIDTKELFQLYNSMQGAKHGAMQGAIEIFPRLRGGGFLDIFGSLLQIGKVFFLLLDIIKWFIKFIVWLVFFIIAVLKFMFVDLIFDFYNTIVLVIITIFKTPIDIVSALFAWVMNGIGGWMTTIWGWDQSNLSKRDKESNYFKGIDMKKGRKCYLTNNGKVPFSILLGTILCPPMGVFMDLGVSGWFNIMICVILTLMYYIPGLVYALLVIYS